MANLNTPHSSAAASSSSVASSSSASSSYCKWDAFINHRGVDVKNTFASHLYRRLTRDGLRVFLDRDELEEGENFPSQIQQAIRGASLHIAIFSPRYAQSTWCLKELVLMVQSGATILPVFYKVDPSVLRWTLKSGEYFEALRKLEQKTSQDCETGELKPRYSSDTVQNWRDALSVVADISGFVLHGDEDDEGELLDDVVKSVLKKVPKPLLDVAEHPTGLNLKLQEFEKTVFSRQEAERVGAKVVGIVGMGGIGKTTLAKAFFNLRKSNYSNSSFLFEVRENTRKHGINYLQRKLIRDLTGLDVTIEHRDEGVGMVIRHLSFSRHALVVLDDVDDISQVKSLLPDGNILSYDSLILYTSRDKHVLASSGVSDSSMYYLRGLNTSHSEQLFCSYAFNQPLPLPKFADMAHRFVRACDGLPLSLKVLGALVRGQNESYWEEILNQLDKIVPTTEIQDILKISYDSLSPNEKQIFLDIACFFIGEREDTAISIWGSVGFQNLHNKCLLELHVDSKQSAEQILDADRGGSRIKMHDHIRDLGRHISQGGEMPLRLWHSTTNDIKDLLERSSREITEVRGITFRTRSGTSVIFPTRMVWYKRWIGEVFGRVKYSSGFCGISNLQLIDIEDGRYLERILKKVRSSHLKWLRCYNYPYTCLPSWIPMESLTVLHLQGDRLKTLWQHESQAPLELRELAIRSESFSFSKFPKSIGQLKRLQKISLYSLPFPKRDGLKSLPEEFSNLSSLKYLILYGCHQMRSLPESFGMLTNLQHVDLTCACRLQMLPESFGNLIRLKTLKLLDCSSLTMSSTTLGNITTLEELGITGCHNVREVPPQVAHQRCLKYLKLDRAKIKELPSWIGNLCNLEALSIGSDSLKLLLPDHFVQLAKLEELRVQNCGIEYLPQDLPNNLRSLEVCYCPLLREVRFERTEGERETGRELNKTLESLEYLHVSECRKLKSISGLAQLTKLKQLHVIGCDEMVELSGLKHLMLLNYLNARYCPKLRWEEGLLEGLRQRQVDVQL